MTNEETRLITGCGDSELRVWEINYNHDANNQTTSTSKKRTVEHAGLEDDENALHDEVNLLRTI